MIEINLRPGGEKKAKRTRGTKPAFRIGSSLPAVSPTIKNPFILIAVVGVLGGIAGTGYLFLALQTRASALAARETQAVQDSTRYAAVLTERRAAEANRDSVMRQLAIIRVIDGDRYVWPHLLDEISEALPPYTWIRTITQSSVVPTLAQREALSRVGQSPPPAAGDSAADSTALPPKLPERLTLRLVGRTVDIQALTRFMRALEASPFIEGVTLVQSDLGREEERELTEFALDMKYEKPPASAIRMVPLTIAVR